jgi:hypothetical protein
MNQTGFKQQRSNSTQQKIPEATSSAHPVSQSMQIGGVGLS